MLTTSIIYVDIRICFLLLNLVTQDLNLIPKYFLYSQPFMKKDTRYLQFPPGQSPLVSHMLIYYGNNASEAVAPPMPSSCMHNMIFLDYLRVIRKDNKTKGLRLDLFMDEGKLS